MKPAQQIFITLLLVLTLCAVGCQESVEQRLGLAYTVPAIPADLEQFFTPSPDQKAFEELRDGETQIDMHEYYRGFHHSGWNAAISEYGRRVEREFKTERDVRMTIQAMVIGCDAYWIGYDEAYRKIETAAGKLQNNPNAE